MQNTTIEITEINKYAICSFCGHYYFLHMSNFKGECDACDSPEIPLDKKCPEFKP